MNPFATAFLFVSIAAGLTERVSGHGDLATSPMALVVPLMVGSIVFVVTNSALRQMRAMGPGSRMVCAVCGSVLAALGLRGNSAWPADHGVPPRAVPHSAPLINAVAIPWTALGIAIAAVIVFLFVLKAVRQMNACLRGLHERVGAIRKRIAGAGQTSVRNGPDGQAVRGPYRPRTVGTSQEKSSLAVREREQVPGCAESISQRRRTDRVSGMGNEP